MAKNKRAKKSITNKLCQYRFRPFCQIRAQTPKQKIRFCHGFAPSGKLVPKQQNKHNTPETVIPQLVGKNITFAVVGQITHMNHQNNQEEKYHLLCDGRCPHQIRLFTTGGFRRPHQFFFVFFFYFFHFP